MAVWHLSMVVLQGKFTLPHWICAWRCYIKLYSVDSNKTVATTHGLVISGLDKTNISGTDDSNRVMPDQ